MDTITITAQQAAERLLTMKLGFAFLVIVVICATAWFIRIALMQTKCDVARSKASAIRTADRNKSERMNWIAANNELHAQNEQLRAEVERLAKENERLRGVMARVKVAEL
jgi:Tfp pilus assembly protein PilO